MRDLYVILFGLSFFILPIWAWGWYGIPVSLCHYFIVILRKRGKISAFTATIPMALVCVFALKALIGSYFVVSSWLVWFVPVCYLIIILILMIPTKKFN
jgi:hypothetical protein